MAALFRHGSKTSFRQIFEKAFETMEKLNIEIKRPRITNRQKYCDHFDVSDDDIYTYWRLSIYILLLDEIIHGFDTRFSDRNMLDFNLNFSIITLITF